MPQKLKNHLLLSLLLLISCIYELLNVPVKTLTAENLVNRPHFVSVVFSDVIVGWKNIFPFFIFLFFFSTSTCENTACA